MKVLLVTLHAKHVHASLALPYLAAACHSENLTIALHEYSINERLEAILPRLVTERAEIVAFSCYIWNIEQTLKLAADLKQLAPSCFLVLGGPEVSYGSHELLAANDFLDCVVRGEGEETFGELVKLLAACGATPPSEKQLEGIDGISFRSNQEIVTTPERGAIADLDRIPSPFAAGLIDPAKPLVYIEGSRGCPFACAFCLSSRENGVRSFSDSRIASDLQLLIDRHAETIKLVDRTFNYDANRANRIWQFILDRNVTSRFHFEIAAELLTEANFALLATVPPDTFRFEIGVQSTAAGTLASVGRSSNLEKLFANIARLRQETAITIHLDLVAGLPEEDLNGFVASLERMLALRPHHIQVEPLKVLKGTAMRKIARQQQYAYSSTPPYKILRTPWLSFDDICRIESAAKALDRFYNSGKFRATLAQLAPHVSLAHLFVNATLEDMEGRNLEKIFAGFLRLGAGAVPAEFRIRLVDALRFDYCMTGYPGNTIPPFLAPATATSSQVPPLTHPEIADRLAIPPTCRIRTYTSRFLHDHSGSLPPGEECLIVFVYFSAGGRETVRTLSLLCRER